MPTDILMPALSPTMEEGTLAKWLVKEGDSVSSGDLLAEIETDKATMEFEAVDEGIIGKILVAEGTEAVKVNTPIAVLLEEGETEADIAPKAAAKAADEAASKDASAPSGGSAEVAPPAQAPQSAPQSPAQGATRRFASPLARRIAKDAGLDLNAITGSGPHGRIVKADVEAAKATPKAAQPAAIAEAPQKQAAPAKAPQSPSADQIKALYQDRQFEEVTLDGMRKTIAARLGEAKQTIPHFYLRREIELDALLKLRGELNAGLAASGVKLSVNDFIIKASAMALQAVPGCNAVWAEDRILQMKSSDVAVAVAIEGGLFTPVLRDAESRTLSSLSTQMKDLAARARSRKLAPHEYQGGSFAISNLGMMGVENFDAVINPPHGSILAVGAGIKKPLIGADDQIRIATVMSVTLSVDHRVIDGALGAEFLQSLKSYLENPLTMLA